MALTLHGTVADNTAVLDRRYAKPLIINGDMQVAQRGTSLTGQTGTAFQMDRFGFQMDTFGTWTMTQADDGPTGSGFTHALKWDCTTADTSLDAGHFGLCHYRIEGQDLQLLKKGTSSAEKITVAFWVKSAKTGTYVLEVYDQDNSRHISQTYTIDSANTWEQKILVFPGDTTGALDNDNGSSLAISWWLGAGSNYNSATLQTSWGANDTDARATGVVNLADSTSNDWLLTGVQIEVGEFDANSIPPFQHESFGDSLIRCQRYCQVFAGGAANDVFATGQAYGTTNWLCCLPFHTQMRTQPSVAYAGSASDFHVFTAVAGAAVCASVSATNFTADAVNLIGTTSSGLVAGNATMLRAQNTTATITVTSEI